MTILDRLKTVGSVIINQNYNAVRIWISPADWAEFETIANYNGIDILQKVYWNDVPIIIDNWWNQPTRIIIDDGTTMIF